MVISLEVNLDLFDSVAVVGVPYTIRSHKVVMLSGRDGPYEAVVCDTADGHSVLFSGAAVVDAFSRLVSRVPGYPGCAVNVLLGESVAKNDKTFRVIKRCWTDE